MSLTIDKRSLNALKLAAGAANWTQIAHGAFLIPSQSDPTQHYVTTPSTCTCPDSERHPERLCKHSISASLVQVLLTPDVPVNTTYAAQVARIFARA
jgi:hypothetical protein